MSADEFNLELVTAPASEPVTLAEAKQHLNLSSATTADDTQITALITAGREELERHTRLMLLTQTWKLHLPQFPGSDCLGLRLSPVQSVSSVAYVDEDGASQTFDAANYVLHAARKPAVVELAYNVDWPNTREQLDAVTITLVAGYASAALVPARAKQAIKLWVEVEWDGLGANSPQLRRWNDIANGLMVATYP